MKQYFLRKIAPYHYPQRQFAKSILHEINKLPPNSITLIDAPCGNGETSYNLCSYPRVKVFGYDLDSRSVINAQQHFKRTNLHFEKREITEVFNIHEQIDVFCLINSLFLLPDATQILNLIHNKLKNNGCLFVVIPNTKGANFLYTQQTDTSINKLKIDKEEIIPYFEKHGFKVSVIKELIFARSYNRKDLKLFSVFSHFYLSFLNFIQIFFHYGTPNYFLVKLEKQKF